MRLSRYCVPFPHRRDPEKVILYSTLNSAILEIPKSLIGEIRREELPIHEMQIMNRLGFLVNDSREELQQVREFMREMNTLKKNLSLIVLLNRACNLACPYCFEGNRKGHFHMSPRTADRLLSAVREMGSPQKEGIHITWYGGEPLLSQELIIQLSKRIKAEASAAGKSFTFSLITNGTLLVPALARQLRSLGLRGVSVTLDGPREHHDVSRPFRSGKGSFDAIIRNLETACDIVDLQVGGNYTRENYREFPRLLDYLSEHGLPPKKICSVKFDPVAKVSEEFAPRDYHAGCATINEPWIAEAAVYLREEILRRGYRAHRIMPAVCMMEFDDALVIDHDGGLYKCPGLIGRPDYMIGTLGIPQKDYGDSHALENWKNSECLECKYLPLCFGGCRQMTLVRNGSMQGLDCRKPFYDATLESLVEQDIRYGLAARDMGTE
jgi:uncharacterized protein